MHWEYKTAFSHGESSRMSHYVIQTGVARDLVLPPGYTPLIFSSTQLTQFLRQVVPPWSHSICPLQWVTHSATCVYVVYQSNVLTGDDLFWSHTHHMHTQCSISLAVILTLYCQYIQWIIISTLIHSIGTCVEVSDNANLLPTRDSLYQLTHCVLHAPTSLRADLLWATQPILHSWTCRHIAGKQHCV